LFGSDTHQYVVNPPLSWRKLCKIESLVGSTLPEDYRVFLLYWGDGGAGPGYSLYDATFAIHRTVNSEEATLNKPFPLLNSDAQDLITKRLQGKEPWDDDMIADSKAQSGK
jgi:hypothetical protein